MAETKYIAHAVTGDWPAVRDGFNDPAGMVRNDYRTTVREAGFGTPLAVAVALLPLLDFADRAELLAAVGRVAVTPFPADDAVVRLFEPADPSESPTKLTTVLLAGG